MTDRQSTHGHDCWGWGPKHYECAVREIKALRAEVERANGWNERVSVCRDHVADIVDGPCVICALDAAEARADKLRAEVATWEGLHASEVQVRQRWQARAERLEQALRELEGREQRDEAMLRQALSALECSDWYMGQLELIVYSHDDTEIHDARAKVQSTIAALRERLRREAVKESKR